MQSLLLKYETTSGLSSSDNVNVLRRQGKQNVTSLVKKWFTVPINTTDGHISKRRSTVKQSQHKSCKTCQIVTGTNFKKKKPLLPFTGYGMTEVGVTHANTKDEYRHKSVGKLLPYTEMKLRVYLKWLKSFTS